MINVSTKTIKQLNFQMFNTTAIALLADYLDHNYQKLSIEQHIPAITKFLIHIHNNCNDIINKETTNNYIDNLFNGTYSTACSARTQIKQFTKYLNQNHYCDYIVINPAPQEQIQQTNNNTTNINKLKKTYKYYDIFGLKYTATEQEIKKAYHKLATIFHPDVNHEDTATERFASIVHIYEILSDEQERFEYDVTMGLIDGYVTERKKSDYYVKI